LTVNFIDGNKTAPDGRRAAIVGHCPAASLASGTPMLIFRRLHRSSCRLLICLGAIAAVLAETVGAQAQDNSAFHEVETKYIFGNFTVG